MDTNSQKTTQETADQRTTAYVTEGDFERICALAFKTRAVSIPDIIDRALAIGLRHLEGGGE